ncbi:hypothetical protein LB577_30060 [Mesorhizobium sp. B283B1A]|uniref:hypothetical protein n=1 Tax=Mesorhizobium TaxID=68287 RepID=UPI001CD100F1|nr:MULTISPECIES: hypothetical protein [Mesorhizobium]MCA0051156.1 hypothetical protein [Mesorhizobium sp. B283B1A]UQS64575.1 hypothetical protein M5D98_31750 [Mesorhizobium opportunistum]
MTMRCRSPAYSPAIAFDGFIWTVLTIDELVPLVWAVEVRGGFVSDYAFERVITAIANTAGAECWQMACVLWSWIPDRSDPSLLQG